MSEFSPATADSNEAFITVPEWSEVPAVSQEAEPVIIPVVKRLGGEALRAMLSENQGVRHIPIEETSLGDAQHIKVTVIDAQPQNPTKKSFWRR